jgi:hypothetical protein
MLALSFESKYAGNGNRLGNMRKLQIGWSCDPRRRGKEERNFSGCSMFLQNVDVHPHSYTQKTTVLIITIVKTSEHSVACTPEE